MSKDKDNNSDLDVLYASKVRLSIQRPLVWKKLNMIYVRLFPHPCFYLKKIGVVRKR